MLPNLPPKTSRPASREIEPKGERQELLNSSWFEPCTDPSCEKKEPPADGETGGISKAVSEGVYSSTPESSPDSNRGRNR
ncbi:MAG: hypothetical protein KF691_13305 [Phycisphaeraceae bacterium]|nr:hypothetical protein [Phycisphaeraceae bacterium]